MHSNTKNIIIPKHFLGKIKGGNRKLTSSMIFLCIKDAKSDSNMDSMIIINPFFVRHSACVNKRQNAEN